MKFFSVTVISLSLGCQVLAAPVDVPAPVAGVAALLPGAPSPVTPAASYSYSVEPTSHPTSYPTSFPPVQKSIDIAAITGAVSALKSHISPDLSKIQSFSARNASNVTTYAGPIIKSHLESIVTHIETTITDLAPALVGSALPLVAGEAEALLSALAELESLVFNIKTILSSVLSTLKSDVVILLTPEIAIVFGLIVPLVTPLIEFVDSIASLAPGGDAALAQLASKASAVKGLVSTLKSGPIGGGY